MANRVATNAAINRISSDLTRTFNRMSDVQSQISSGRRLQRPSDDPSKVANAMEERATRRRLEQYTANATDASGWLKATDDTLVALQEQAAQAKARATSAVNGGTSAATRQAIAADIENIRSSMLQLANATYQGRSLFAGTAAVAQAYTASGTYDGDDGAVSRTIDEGVTLQVNVHGTEVFGAADTADPLAGDLFQVLGAMADAARSGSSTAMAAASGALDGAIDRMSEAQIRVGGAAVQVDTTIGRNELVMLDVKERLSSIEDVDLAEAIISLRSDEASYQAALGVTARVIQPSLLDFLR